MIGAIVLAAGQSRRMGNQKLLLPWRGQTVIGHVVDQVRGAAGVGRVLVVTGADGEAVERELAGRGVRAVRNLDAHGDMLSSVRCGIRALEGECEALLVALGDQPAVRSEVIRRVIEAYRCDGRSIVVPAHGGRRGHPILFAAGYGAEILRDFDGEGLVGLLRAHAGEVSELVVEEPGVLEDLDTPEDYRRALGRGGDGGVG